LDEEKSSYLGLAQEIGFSPAYLLSLLRLVKSTANICTCREEYNKYDMTGAPCF
jgi:hypothetical protein